MSEQVGSVTHKKSSDFHAGIRFQSSFTIRWELGDKNFLKIDIICLDDSVKYQIMAIITNENFIPFSQCDFQKASRETKVTLSAHARTIPRFLGFSYFSQNKQIWAAKIDHPNFEGGLSFNRSSVSQLKDINIKTNSTWRQKSMFHVLYGIFSVDKALLVDT